MRYVLERSFPVTPLPRGLRGWERVQFHVGLIDANVLTVGVLARRRLVRPEPRGRGNGAFAVMKPAFEARLCSLPHRRGQHVSVDSLQPYGF